MLSNLNVTNLPVTSFKIFVQDAFTSTQGSLCVIHIFLLFQFWSSHPVYHISFILLQKILQVAIPSCTTVAFVIVNNLCVFECAYCVQVYVCARMCVYTEERWAEFENTIYQNSISSQL